MNLRRYHAGAMAMKMGNKPNFWVQIPFPVIASTMVGRCRLNLGWHFRIRLDSDGFGWISGPRNWNPPNQG